LWTCVSFHTRNVVIRMTISNMCCDYIVTTGYKMSINIKKNKKVIILILHKLHMLPFCYLFVTKWLTVVNTFNWKINIGLSTPKNNVNIQLVYFNKVRVLCTLRELIFTSAVGLSQNHICFSKVGQIESTKVKLFYWIIWTIKRVHHCQIIFS
jgi:hypothetical protein